MNIQISQENLQTGIQAVQNIVSARSALPILSNVLLEAVEGKLVFRATDLDISISTSVPTIVFDEGAITVPAKRFADVVKELPNISISLEVEQEGSDFGVVTIKSERGVFKMMGIEKDEFPNFPDVSADNQFVIEDKKLKHLIQKVIYAVSTDETRPALCGVLFEVASETITAVATDGKRLAKFELDVETGVESDEPLQVIVPPKALSHFNHLVGSNPQDVEVTFDDNYIVFQFGDTTIYSRLIEGPYPDYRQVIPTDNDKTLVVNRADFASALRRVSILANQQTRQVRLFMQTNKIDLSANTSDVGEAKEGIQANYVGEEMSIGYNATFLLDILKNVDSEEIKMEFSTPVGAGIFVPSMQEEGEDYMTLCMPLRLLDH